MDKLQFFLLFYCQNCPVNHCVHCIFKQFFNSQDSGCPPLKIKNLNFMPVAGDQHASPCQISSKSAKTLQRNGNLTVFTMAAVRHLGFSEIRNFSGRHKRGTGVLYWRVQRAAVESSSASRRRWVTCRHSTPPVQRASAGLSSTCAPPHRHNSDIMYADTHTAPHRHNSDIMYADTHTAPHRHGPTTIRQHTLDNRRPVSSV